MDFSPKSSAPQIPDASRALALPRRVRLRGMGAFEIAVYSFAPVVLLLFAGLASWLSWSGQHSTDASAWVTPGGAALVALCIFGVIGKIVGEEYHLARWGQVQRVRVESADIRQGKSPQHTLELVWFDENISSATSEVSRREKVVISDQRLNFVCALNAGQIVDVLQHPTDSRCFVLRHYCLFAIVD